MPITGAVMVPHPPLIIPQVGRGREKGIQDTIRAYRKASAFLAEGQPDTVVVVTPHSVMYSDYNHVSPGMKASGDFGRFGAPSVKIDVRYDVRFAQVLIEQAEKSHVAAGFLGEDNPALDHATLIPLYFLNEAYDRPYQVVRIGIAGSPLTDHYRLGMAVRKAADLTGRKVCVIASGDLSHRLTPDAPYGCAPEGAQYDKEIMDIMGKADFGRLFSFAPGMLDKAGECGHRCFAVLAGAFDSRAVLPERLSYEGPFGVGYGVCTFRDAGPAEGRAFADEYDKGITDRISSADEDVYVLLARQTIERYVLTGSRTKDFSMLPDELRKTRAGAFVSIHEKGNLRGCIGTVLPARSSLAEEIAENAVSAASKDPRFRPVRADELPYLEISVDVLSSPEAVNDPSMLDPSRYGVIVTSGTRRGVLLPDLEGIDTKEEQIRIAKRKAGIPESEEDLVIERFEVVRHEARG